MNQIESKFWKLIKPHLLGDVSRIENTVDRGTPDITAVAYDRDYWVELKVCNNIFKERNIKKLLRPEQIVWHARRVKHGSLIFVIVRYPDSIITYRREKKEYVYITTHLKNGNSFNWKSFESVLIREIMRTKRWSD